MEKKKETEMLPLFEKSLPVKKGFPKSRRQSPYFRNTTELVSSVREKKPRPDQRNPTKPDRKKENPTKAKKPRPNPTGKIISIIYVDHSEQISFRIIIRIQQQHHYHHLIFFIIHQKSTTVNINKNCLKNSIKNKKNSNVIT